jgi:hypothetical protein
MEIDVDAEVSVKEIVNFYIKINDSSKARKDLARLSAKDKAAALEVIAASGACREFRIEVARYFLYDLDRVVRRKAERFMEELVPDWVTDPAESILKLLKSADGKGTSHRNSAVRFLLGIVDANSLRDTFTTLLNSRNREHLVEILAIVEDYIDSSHDEHELVNIFNACLDIVVSDEIDNNIKHHASNLLSVFFKKVASTHLGETLHRKYIEKQVDKAEGVYRYLCSGASGLDSTFLADLLRPLAEGGSSYQIKILTYFKSVLAMSKDPEACDTVLDTYPDYWNRDEPAKEEKIRYIRSRVLRAADDLWSCTDDPQVRALIVQIRFGEYSDKRELFEQIMVKSDDVGLTPAAREKLALMLRCFVHPEQPAGLKLQAAELLLFKLGDTAGRLAAVESLAADLENGMLSHAEEERIAVSMELLLGETPLEEPVRNKARYLLFIADPKRVKGEAEQKALLDYLRGAIEEGSFSGANAGKRLLDALGVFLEQPYPGEDLKKAARALELKIKIQERPAAWNRMSPD